MFEQKLYKNGSSVVVTVPKQLLRKHKLRDGSEVVIDSTSKGNGIIIKPQKKSKSTSSKPGLTPEFKQWLDDVSRDEEKLIRELAKR